MRGRVWLFVAVVLAAGVVWWFQSTDPSRDAHAPSAAAEIETKSGPSLRGELPGSAKGEAPGGVAPSTSESKGGGAQKASDHSDTRRRIRIIARLDGKEAADVSFELWDEGGSEDARLVGRMETDAQGRASAQYDSGSSPHVVVTTKGYYIRGSRHAKSKDGATEILLARGTPIRVEVADATTGRALSDAAIEVIPFEGESWWGRTDERGEVLVPGVPGDGEVMYYAYVPGYTAGVLAARMVKGVSHPDPVRLLLTRGAWVGGLVLDLEGRPAAGARVLITMPPQKQRADAKWERTRGAVWREGRRPQHFDDTPWTWAWRTVSSDRDGRFRFDGLPAEGTVMFGAVWNSHRTNISEPIQLDARGADVVLRAEPPASLRVAVTWEDGSPCTEAGTVLLEGRWLRRHERPLEGGAANFTLLPAGPYVVSAKIPGLLSDHVRIDPRPGRPAVTTLTIYRGARITGHVEDRDGQPVLGALVTATPGRTDQEQPEWTADRKRARTLEDGRFTLDGLERRPYWLTAHVGDDAAGAQATPAPSRVTAPADQVRLRVEALAGIRARLIDEQGQPVEGQVEWTASSGRTNVGQAIEIREGKLAIDGLRAGTWKLTVKQAGRAPGSKEGIRLEAGKTTDAGEITLERGIRVTVRVETMQGAPIAGARVHVNHLAGQNSPTDAEGRYRSRVIAPGKVSLMVEAPGYESRDLEVTRNEDSDVVIPLRSTAPHQGRVRTESGASLPDGTLLVLTGESPPHLPGTIEAQEGAISARIAPDGTFTVHAAAGTWQARIARLVSTDPVRWDETALGTWVLGDRPTDGREFLVPGR